MTISIFEIFKIGVGPSSSHTVGPMRAAREFVSGLEDAGTLETTHKVVVELYGSLALTGRGHATDTAILAGLEGAEPATIDVDAMAKAIERIRGTGRMRLLGEHEIGFDENEHLLWHRSEVLPRHSNGMRFTALDENAQEIAQQTYYSVGGGFVVSGDEPEGEQKPAGDRPVPYPFGNAEELLRIARDNDLRIADLVLENEKVRRDEAQIRARLLEIWQVMQECVERGFREEGVLPGVLKVKRRAPKLYRDLTAAGSAGPGDFMDWVNAFALAVNEENAAGGRVVTAPTNGAAGIIPSVLHYYRRFIDGADEEGVIRLLLVAGAIGILYKKNASISGAEMGCMGEVGVACSMAAGGLTAALGGSNEQVENAAEIGMEHNLGLTCDPIAGLVQIPCIERNAMGSMKAINAARMAMRGDGTHKVSLDQVIATMRQTGRDMQTIYKETSQGGLAVNVPEC
ncbi:L-serine ammonia-lyase [soil metagenome]